MLRSSPAHQQRRRRQRRPRPPPRRPYPIRVASPGWRPSPRSPNRIRPYRPRSTFPSPSRMPAARK
ncbi:hypothetical protein DDD64_07195 [Actinotignum sanguinis]|nr:hypothetical protein DDD64_07195 [Actinotignum sanguinis]